VSLAIPASARGTITVEAEGVRLRITVQRGLMIALRSSGRAARAGGTLVLRGTIDPGARQTVRIEARSGGRWVEVTRVRTGRNGAFSTPVRLSSRGTYLVRARLAEHVSGTVRLRAD
jgi:hypothetical protein